MTKRPRPPPFPFELRAFVSGDEDGYVVLSHALAAPLASASTLTAVEHDIVRRIVAGDSNAEIARARGTSQRTVANQVAGVLRKLGVASRRELAALVAGTTTTR